MNELFRKIAHWSAEWMGSASAFIWSSLLVIVWALCGPWFHYSDTWQLVINTATTVLTFLMVFLVQNTQNRDNAVVQLKLDELIHAVTKARNSLVDLEDAPDSKISELQKEFEDLRNLIENK